MAPSVRGASSRVSKRQPSVRANAKISKSSQLHPAVKSALEDVAIKPVVVIKSGKQIAKHVTKRKRDQVQNDSDSEQEHERDTKFKSKKARVQLQTPPSSQRQSPVELELSPSINFRQLSLHQKQSQQELSPGLQDLVSLHAAFLKAFSLHIVHNGQSVPASLVSLMSSVTRLWKKHTVAKEDIQRVLAIYELDVSTDFTGQLLRHQEGPFKLTMTGSDHFRCNVEYVGLGSNGVMDSRWNEANLQKLYEAEIEGLWISLRTTPTSWIHGEVCYFPKLDFDMGIQTQARTAKAEATRKEILGLASQAQNRPGAQFALQTSSNTGATDVQAPQVVQSRTLSLLDRVRAKAAASASSTSETPEAVLRGYAVGRISEVVEIIRMKQQRKLSSSFASSVHSSPSKVRGKVSFSMNHLISDIKGSLQVPLGDAELKMCFKILQDEFPGVWLSIYVVGSVQSVVLNGTGMSGIEVKRILDEREKTR